MIMQGKRDHKHEFLSIEQGVKPLRYSSRGNRADAILNRAIVLPAFFNCAVVLSPSFIMLMSFYRLLRKPYFIVSFFLRGSKSRPCGGFSTTYVNMIEILGHSSENLGNLAYFSLIFDFGGDLFKILP